MYPNSQHPLMNQMVSTLAPLYFDSITKNENFRASPQHQTIGSSSPGHNHNHRNNSSALGSPNVNYSNRNALGSKLAYRVGKSQYEQSHGSARRQFCSGGSTNANTGSGYNQNPSNSSPNDKFILDSYNFLPANNGPFDPSNPVQNRLYAQMVRSHVNDYTSHYVHKLPAKRAKQELSPHLAHIQSSPQRQRQLDTHQLQLQSPPLSQALLPTSHIRNVEDIVDGYPKLHRLLELKEQHNSQHFPRPWGCRVSPDKVVETLSSWVYQHNILFDTIMVGSLTENQFVLPILTQLPIDKLCSKPGFLYIWGSAHKMNEMTNLLGGIGNKGSLVPWTKKFRRSEELVFTTKDTDTAYRPYQDDSSLFIRKQWHCAMCITGTVKRSEDGHLIHCNVNTDLKVQDESEKNNPSSVPDSLYKVAENFASGNRRLHIIPSRSGFDTPVKLRNGWVIMSPDIMLDNFDPQAYKDEIQRVGYNVPPHDEIESIRPRSPKQEPK